VKEGIHPDYRPVVFQDTLADFSFLTRSTIRTKETIKWEDGNEYPLVRVDISSASHPFFTGKHKFVDAAGRIEKFQRRHQWNEGAKDKIGEKAPKRKKGREKVSVGVPNFKRKDEPEEEEGKGKKPAGKDAKAAGGEKGAEAKGADAKSAKSQPAEGGEKK
jgi:large subunit ribosomal protein L31